MTTITRAAIASGLALALFAGTSGCDLETNAPAIIMTGVLVPEDDCTVRATGGSQQQTVPRGILDLSVTTSYYAFISVNNNFQPSDAIAEFEVTDGRLDGSTVTFTQAELTFRINTQALTEAYGELGADGLAGLGLSALATQTGTSPVGGAVEPGTGGAVGVQLIPDNIGQLLRNVPALGEGAKLQVVVEVTLVGRRADGDTVKSGVFEFPIDVCNNCLVIHALSPEVASAPFTLGGLGAGDLEFCNPGQDSPITNAFCGVRYGTERPDGGNQCALDRCLGTSASLVCANDPSFIAP